MRIGFPPSVSGRIGSEVSGADPVMHVVTQNSIFDQNISAEGTPSSSKFIAPRSCGIVPES